MILANTVDEALDAAATLKAWPCDDRPGEFAYRGLIGDREGVRHIRIQIPNRAPNGQYQDPGAPYHEAIRRRNVRGRWARG